ncbi:sensor histidine kinase [uncultured Nostoc sp.]|uniref:sensor histidine kinase n=1 Tax=uncultured Nostoc sp. TaxID=340711 RepID=UPI0035C9B8E3
MILLPKTEILVVDDLRDNLRLLSNLLRSQGYEVRTAINGTMALRSAQSEPPALILLDINMPDIDGYEVCRQLKASEETRNIPIIFISALDDALDKVKAFQVGGVDYITKPFRVEEMLIRIETQLKVQRFTQTLEQQVEQRTGELSQALHHLQQAQIQLVQQEKLSALGNLMAGVAHEINNPIGFIAGNLNEAQQRVQELMEHLNLYRDRAPEGDIANHAEEIDLDYLLKDLPKMIDSMKMGCDRLKNISTSLRTFSRADKDYKVPFNIHQGIDSTILILKHRLKANEQRPAIEVITEYGDLPQVECFPGQLNQVFMNILANAIDALEESNDGQNFEGINHNPNKIIIKTSVEDQQVKISIADNAKGMSEEVKQKIFDHLFTTKAVGKGTGLGLAIARQIVEETHGGKLSFNSVLGQGTEFIIEIPV